MRLITKIFALIFTLYVVFWGSVALYFSYAETHKGLLESNLSSVFKRTVTIKEVRTLWRGLSPTIQLSGFSVAGDLPQVPALAFESLTAQVTPFSMLTIWPKFTEFAVERPSLEIVSLENNRLQIAGFTMGSNRSKGLNAKRLLTWLLNHQSAAWHDGEVVWRRLNGDQQRFNGISFVYDREEAVRTITASAATPKGTFAFKAQSTGDILEESDWDANFEVLGNAGKQLVSSDDLLVTVQDGEGKLQLKTLDIARINDVLLLAGLADNAKWLLDANFSGALKDVSFNFSGPILELRKWSLEGIASEVSFSATSKTPGVTNLAGELFATNTGGTFKFNAQNTVFDWPKWYDDELTIDRAIGQFSWTLVGPGKVDIAMKDGFFEDQIVKVWDINSKLNIDTTSRNVSNFAQLFSVESVQDLSYEDGKIVQSEPASSRNRAPIFADANAKFSVKSLPAIVNYFPNDPRVEKLQEWWKNAFIAGSASNGAISYQGEVTRTAVRSGMAHLRGSADYVNAQLDYGYQKDWPKLSDSHGHVTLEQQSLRILPKEAWIDKHQVGDAVVSIENLFQLDRSLHIEGGFTMPLPEAMDFLFDGPLIKRENRGRPLPIIATQGSVLANVNVDIPLAKVRDAKVTGTAAISDGRFILPQGVEVNNASANVDFTEQSATSSNITAEFLDGPVTAVLSTEIPAQPPILKVTAQGSGDVGLLMPWVGEHVLSLLEGRSDWGGDILIDGPKASITANADMVGVAINAPAPLGKNAQEKQALKLEMQVGGADVQQNLSVGLGNTLQARFSSGRAKLGLENESTPSLMDRVIVQIDNDVSSNPAPLQDGVNFLVNHSNVNIDDWLAAITDLARMPTTPLISDKRALKHNGKSEPDSSKPNFLDAMRSVRVNAENAIMFGRPFGELRLSAQSVDGKVFVGHINGEHISGSLNAEPRAESSRYEFDLDHFNLVEASDAEKLSEPIDHSLRPENYIDLKVTVGSFELTGKRLGRLSFHGAPQGNEWRVDDLVLEDNGIRTTAVGRWVNNTSEGSLSSFDINTTITEAGDVLDEMKFIDLIKKGDGTFTSNIHWIGSPGEFEFARLNGEFDLRIEDGELVKVESGAGKLLGLLNFNSIARRLILDFRDVFSSGLSFDRMVYSGLLADGEAILRDAHLLCPAAFVRMQGKIDLNKELIDMEVHVAPDIGGNLVLLSALANPTAGAVVFLTQQLFKDKMRSTSLMSYRALGTWEDFELVEFNINDSAEQANEAASKQSESSVEADDARDALPTAKASEVDVQSSEPAASSMNQSDAIENEILTE